MKFLYFVACLPLMLLAACDPLQSQSAEFEVNTWPSDHTIVVDTSQMGEAANVQPTRTRSGASDRDTYKFDRSIKVIVVPLDAQGKPHE